MRNDLLNLLADLEAGLDFTDEGLTFVSHSEVLSRIDAAIGSLELLLKQASNRLWNKDLPAVVIVGPANAGKSTLFNALTGVSAAIVSSQPGTTRDLLFREVCWEGISLRLLDSAGEEHDPAEQIQDGLRLRDEQILHAQVILQCTPPGEDERDRSREMPGSGRGSVVRVQTKSDLAETQCQFPSVPTDDLSIEVSALNGSGIGRLKQLSVDRIGKESSAETVVGR